MNPNTSTQPADQRELTGLLNRLFDRGLEPAEEQRLNALLEQSGAARRAYLCHLDLHLELERRLGGFGAPDRAAAVLDGGAADSPGARHLIARPLAFGSAVLALAASIVLGLWLLPRAPVEPGTTVAGDPTATRTADTDPAMGATTPANLALLVGSRQAVWAAPDRTDRADPVAPGLPTGDYLPAGRLELEAGEIDLSFANGAEITLHAPASFEVLAADELQLDRGRLAARMPDSAVGFIIRTPQSAIVDLGTEFSMNVHEDGDSEVLVHDGKVVASLLSDSGSTLRDYTVQRGQAVSIHPGRSAMDAIDAAADLERFLLPPSMRPPPLAISEAYVDAVTSAEPLAYWRFESVDADRRVRNQVADRWHLQLDDHVRLEPSTDDNLVALFPAEADSAVAMTTEPFAGLNREQGYSIELWVHPGNASWSTVAGLLDDQRMDASQLPYLSVIELMGLSQDRRSGLMHDDFAVRFLHRSPPGAGAGFNAITATAYRPSQWHHLAVVAQAGQLSVYVDGRLMQTTRDPQPVFDEIDYHLVLGRLRPPGHRDDQRQFRGRIDEVAVYPRALSAAEIADRVHLATKRPGLPVVVTR